MKLFTDVCVIGAGAGGTGCVWRLIKNGIKTVVVDKNSDFGGTAVFCGVDGWEPGVSLDGLHRLLVAELEKMENAAHTVELVPNMNLLDKSVGADWSRHSLQDHPWAFGMPTGCTYEDTLKRCTSLRGENGPMRRFQFEPECMVSAIHKVFESYKDNLTTLFNHQYKSCTVLEGRVKSVTVSGESGEVEIFANYFVDCSGDIVLARDAGCEHTIGTEGSQKYGEPCANAESDAINAVTYMFRITKTDDPNHIDTIPQRYQNVDVSDYVNGLMNVTCCFTIQYPNNDVSINMLPTMQGKEYYALGDRADEVGIARVYHYWNRLQTKYDMKGWTIKHIFNAGIRESWRLVGKYVLKEQDVRAGVFGQPKIGKTIAIGDHALDVHGENGMCRELVYPYEIPIECAMTKEYENLFVACRGASFSHIAAATVRLTRTMISMGEGVGEHISEILKSK